MTDDIKFYFELLDLTHTLNQLTTTNKLSG